jgi:hypothetical protein
MSCGVETSTTPAAFTFCASERDVARTGGQVEEQVVELAPVHVAHELQERPGDHGAAPDHGLVGIDEEPDRHELEAVGLDGVEPVAADRVRALGDPGEQRQRGTVDVGVEDAHLGAGAGQ